MRKMMIVLLMVFFSVSGWAAQPQTEDQKALYAMGVALKKQMEIMLSNFHLTAEEFGFVKQGMDDAFSSKPLAAEPEAYQKNIMELAQKRMEAALQKQKDSSLSYLEKSAAEKGAIKMDSGVIYQEISAGTGAQPKSSDVVKVHYTGTLIDGKEFDSSVKRGQPAEFPLGQVIPCWTEGVAKMKVGGKAKLVCPSTMAYGDQGRPPVIPGGAALVFEVELLEIKEAAPEAKAPAIKAPEKTKAKTKK